MPNFIIHSSNYKRLYTQKSFLFQKYLDRQSTIWYYVIERGDNLSITSDIIRGHTETIILAHLNEKDSYGYEINKMIKEKTKGEYELKEATLYCAFKRLEENELIESYWGDENLGARRKYYRITVKGKKAYERDKEDWKQTKKIIDKLI